MLIISANNIIFKNNNSDGVEVDEELLPFYLSEDVSFDNITFERFFKLILRNTNVLDIVFYRSLGGLGINSFEKDFNSDQTLNDMDIHHLEISWAADLYEEDFAFYTDFSGAPENPMEISYSLEFTSLSAYKHLPLHILNDFVLYGKNPSVEILKGKKSMTLYDAINAILYEISFFGNPNDRDESSNNLQEQIESIENGTAQLTRMTFDEMLQELDKLKEED